MQINIHQAKTHFSELLERVAAGEEIIIAKAGRPVAKLVALSKKIKPIRSPGSAKNEIIVSDDFDAPLSEDILRDFHA